VKKFLKIAALIIVIVPLLFLGYLTYSNQKNLARPTALALSALESTDTVSIEEDGNFLVMRPTNASPRQGSLFTQGQTATCAATRRSREPWPRRVTWLSA